MFRRIRSLAAQSFFEGLATLGRLHPASRPERHGVEVERDLIYGDDARWHQLDLYKPIARPKPWPVVFYAHGGAFHLLSKDTHWLMGLVFARFGYLVVNISYRLAPKHPYPAAIQDTCDAYCWLASRIDELGGDRERVAVAGESAGGNLITALTLATVQRRAEPWAQRVFDTGLVPKATLPFCAWLEVSRPERFAERRPLPFWIDSMLRDGSKTYLQHSSETALADPLLDDTRRLEKALEILGVPVEARYYPGGIHAFHALIWNPAARRCWRDALAFLDRHMPAPR